MHPAKELPYWYSASIGYFGYARFAIVITNETQDVTLTPKDTFEDLFKVITNDSTNTIEEAK